LVWFKRNAQLKRVWNDAKRRVRKLARLSFCGGAEGMAKRKIGKVEITADKIAAGIIDRLLNLEKRYSALHKEQNELLEMIVEAQPWLTKEGRLIFKKVMLDNSERTDSIAVEVLPIADDALIALVGSTADQQK
jgi:hypothetical protein